MPFALSANLRGGETQNGACREDRAEECEFNVADIELSVMVGKWFW